MSEFGTTGSPDNTIIDTVNTSVGVGTIVQGTGNSAFGTDALANNSDDGNSAFGFQSMFSNDDGFRNCAFGWKSSFSGTEASSNSSFGQEAHYTNVTGGNCCSFGYKALFTATGSSHSAFGVDALRLGGSGNANTAFGREALYNTATGANNTGLGYQALKLNIAGTAFDFDDCTGIGIDSRTSGDDQVQLGGSTTTAYAYGAVQDRSDQRDKADIVDTDIGLEFLNNVRPVKFRWDYREDYYNEETGQNDPSDGSKKRSRFHQGVIAQEIKSVMDSMGVDFAGYQDHTLKGGNDVLSIGYSEFIPVIIKAIQELNAKIG